MQRIWIGLILVCIVASVCVAVATRTPASTSAPVDTDAHRRDAEVAERDAAWRQKRAEAEFLAQYRALRRQAQVAHPNP